MLKSANFTKNGGIHLKNVNLPHSVDFGEFHLNYLVKSMCVGYIRGLGRFLRIFLDFFTF